MRHELVYSANQAVFTRSSQGHKMCSSRCNNPEILSQSEMDWDDGPLWVVPIGYPLSIEKQKSENGNGSLLVTGSYLLRCNGMIHFQWIMGNREKPKPCKDKERSPNWQTICSKWLVWLKSKFWTPKQSKFQLNHSKTKCNSRISIIRAFLS